MVIVPFWSKLFSITAIKALPAASADPLRVWTNFVTPSSLNLIFALLAWKSVQFEQEDISLYVSWLGIQTSKSYVLAAENPKSPVHNSTTW